MNARHLLRPVSRIARSGNNIASSLIARRITNYAGKTFTLNTGDKIPAIGCGTFQDEEQQEGAVLEALKAGTDYVDLILLHYPCTFARGEERFPKGPDGLMIMGETTYKDTWEALQEIMKSTGKIKAIGVSNFNQEEVDGLIAAGMPPAVHQMEVHPFLSQFKFTQWHKDNGIHVQQFSPLGNQNSFYRDIYWSNGRANRGRLIEEPLLIEIGQKYGKSPAQVALAWGVNHGRSVIPKSTTPWQIAQNVASVFVLEKEDMERIDGLNADLRFNTPDEAYRWPLYKGLDGV
ncbi:aldo/keto reductase [Aspergillus stella-maris]|uniref:aldo/keto reductase n=1 Tax=Aspergillus stella-maris TaxID=1810926 RepID=UPI003CCCA3D9